MSSTQNEPRPRLCYLGSLPVEATSAGPMQLYRLLQTYPPDRLRIIESDCLPSDETRRIRNIAYFKTSRAFARGWFFARTRLPRLFWRMLQAETARQAKLAAKILADSPPEAILTVHEGFSWITAAKLARRFNVPFHIIFHDEWFRDIPMAASLKPRFESELGLVYRAAASRLCISPYMEEEYAARFKAPGSVLYPIRDSSFIVHHSPPESVARVQPVLRVAYAGNIWHMGNWESLRSLASALASINGQLLIFGPTTREEVHRNGLARPNVTVRGRAEDLVQALRDEGHIVFVPMTFEPNEMQNMRISFPSKIVDYSAAGLPMLIYGPEYCSAVRWARNHPDSGEVVTTQGEEPLRLALERLASPGVRARLGRRALELGLQYFSFESGSRLLNHALTSRRSLAAMSSD